MDDLSLAELENRCQQGGLRVTANLSEILQALITGPDHPDVDSLHGRVRARGRRVSLATIYRNLGHLVAASEGDCEMRPAGATFRTGFRSPNRESECLPVICPAILPQPICAR
ncbi:transcriptional repressor [Rhizobium tibeticum]|uniref:transcriptional repressor n=1 Tax=Rhizobium tibeticum TaxID=501024 RepID=UPI001FCD89AD|nr:transcriptional repressor [Rhizobium tibeticum]